MNGDSRAEAIYNKIDEKGPIVIITFSFLVAIGAILMLIYDDLKGRMKNVTG